MSQAQSLPVPAVVHLTRSTLACLRLLVAGDLSGAEQESGLAFGARIWPDDSEMREGLSVHLAACEREPNDLAWRVYLIAGDGDKAVGHAGFKGGPTRTGELEIYWCVEPRWRQRGIATAAAASLCRYAFANETVQSVTATIARTNIASQHVASALGMFNAGEVRHGMPLWRIARSEWQPQLVLNGHPMPRILTDETR
jgi:RimJ/RimL family protein N-acetyltransferase